LTLQDELHDAKSAKQKLARTELPAPGYFSAKGLLHDPQWVDSYISIVLQWPKSCTIAVDDRQLIGLAKSLAFMWEPGILNHTDLALETGFKPEQITEALKVVSAVVGLANLDKAVKGFGRSIQIDRKKHKALDKIEKFFGTIPEVFMRAVIVEDPAWLEDLLTVTLPAYDISGEIISPKLRAYVALAAASVVGWEEGIWLYGNTAQRFGATEREVHDVVKSVFKTSVSNSMAAGFRTPCHIPRLEQYSTILSSYLENGAYSQKRTKDRLSSSVTLKE